MKFNRHSHVSIALMTILAIVAAVSCTRIGESYTSWRTYQGDDGRNQYSSLDYINRHNVGRLAAAWTYRTGDAREDNRSQIQCNPIVIDTMLYASSPMLKIFALHAATGRELWVFDPFKKEGIVEGTGSAGVNRGVMYWEEKGDRRILFTADRYLYALDALTGTPVAEFGTGGRVDLKEGLGRDVTGLFVMSNTPGALYKNLLIMGTRVSEGADSAPGHIRAYDIRTGAQRWIFHTIPHPGEFGYDTWPADAWQRIGGANSWGGMAIDQKRGIVYIPTGSAAYDYYGGNRKGANLFANCLLALDAATGKRIWHFQAVHHDIWDRDFPCTPNLITVTHNARKGDAVAQVTKSAHIFLFDRETGAPLFPIGEQAVPPSDLPGEEAWPTQPLPLIPKALTRQVFREEDITDISPEAHAEILVRFNKVSSAGQFLPPSLEGSIIFPGLDGGCEWGGGACDPNTGILYVNANEMPWILQMKKNPLPEKPGAATLSSIGHSIYSVNCANCHGEGREGNAPQSVPGLLKLESTMAEPEAMNIVQNGKGFMPSFGFLSGMELQALSAFLYDRKDTGQKASGDTAKARTSTYLPYSLTGANRFLDRDGYPAVKPPWGTLNAVDLNTGELVWQSPLGEYEELTKRGIPPTGTENYGGPAVTAGGLIFIGATNDEKFRAFDKDSGKVLWEAALPAGGYATPCTYMAGGKQFVVIACGGGKMGTKSGDAYVAFALPEED